jgi:hypothetical protein
MEDLYNDSEHARLSNTTHPYNQGIKYEGLGKQLMHAANLY